MSLVILFILWIQLVNFVFLCNSEITLCKNNYKWLVPNASVFILNGKTLRVFGTPVLFIFGLTFCTSSQMCNLISSLSCSAINTLIFGYLINRKFPPPTLGKKGKILPQVKAPKKNTNMSIMVFFGLWIVGHFTLLDIFCISQVVSNWHALPFYE